MDIQLKPGERLIPDDAQTPILQIQVLRHLFVYEHVRSRLNPNDKVLDLGFGEGYGTAFLADSCKEIIGVDVEPKVVDYANERYQKDNCHFLKYDGKTLPFENSTFDLVTSFQVIEHIDNEPLFVSEIHRVLKSGGRALLTTPNKATRLKPGQKPFNRFHKREYYWHELQKVLSQSFSTVNVWGVSATDEIHGLEFERIRRGGLMNAMINLGIRKILPESVDLKLSRLLGKMRRSKSDNSTKFKISDFRIEKEKVDESLDLFALCIK
ncbi:MAG TPA: class I SAM-dependent methyltransferase [candidate division Zixibacteria bacterium]|nr:class I SAM-dependent methyltransferase [candidate division Zixibacteria bacterium]